VWFSILPTECQPTPSAASLEAVDLLSSAQSSAGLPVLSLFNRGFADEAGWTRPQRSTRRSPVGRRGAELSLDGFNSVEQITLFVSRLSSLEKNAHDTIRDEPDCVMTPLGVILRFISRFCFCRRIIFHRFFPPISLNGGELHTPLCFLKCELAAVFPSVDLTPR